MTYAPENRNFYDADSHVMELPNFIIDYFLIQECNLWSI